MDRHDGASLLLILHEDIELDVEIIDMKDVIFIYVRYQHAACCVLIVTTYNK